MGSPWFRRNHRTKLLFFVIGISWLRIQHFFFPYSAENSTFVPRGWVDQFIPRFDFNWWWMFLQQLSPVWSNLIHFPYFQRCYFCCKQLRMRGKSKHMALVRSFEQRSLKRPRNQGKNHRRHTPPLIHDGFMMDSRWIHDELPMSPCWDQNRFMSNSPRLLAGIKILPWLWSLLG